MNQFKRNFENYQQFHKLTQKLETNLKLKKMMIEHSGTILRNLIAAGNTIIETKGITFSFKI
jgi:ribosomal protein S17E